MMEIKKNITSQNYNIGSESRIKYIVIHYTANNGDTAFSNTNYFKVYRGSSAHYFVDEKEIWQSVEDRNIAWHCGAVVYKHAYCRNNNSIGIEICSKKDKNGVFYLPEKAVENALFLTKTLMKKYNIKVDNVIRHYDVTGKLCPEPFVRISSDWQKFKNKLVEENKVEVIQKAEVESEMIEKKVINLCGKDRVCEVIFKDGYNFIKLQDLNQASEIAVSYDGIKKIPIIKVSK